MPSAVVGRDDEVAVAVSALEAVRNVPVAGGVRVVGRSGIGKTSLLDAVAGRAQGENWLVLRTECHHIQTQMRLVAVKRLAAAVTAQLGEGADRYAGALEPGSSDDSVEEAFYRLLEGLLLDYPVLLCVDDVQWVDDESERVLSQALRLLGDSRLALVVASRDETSAFADLGLRNVTLGRLDDDAIREIVRTHLPQASADVVAAVVAHAAGLPMTASVLAKETLAANVVSPDDVPASMRAVVARAVHQMPRAQREFLQLCSLIEDPIDYRVIAKLYPGEDAPVEGFLRDLVPAFLVSDAVSFRFAHASIAEGVRQTMPIEIPYRRRVLKALREVEVPTLDDRERIVRQAAACGDRAAERLALVDLAHAATAANSFVTACDAYRRAFAIEAPGDGDFVKEYFWYGSALIFIGRFEESREVFEEALKGASERGLRDGVGVLAGSLMRSLWYVDQSEAIDPTFDRYIGLAQGSNDRAALLSLKGMFHSYRGPGDVTRACKDEVLALPGEVDAISLMRVYQAEAFVEIRSGDYVAAAAALDSATVYGDKTPAGGALAVATSRLVVDWAQHGIRAIVEHLPTVDAAATALGQLNTYRVYLEAFACLAEGDFDGVSLLVEQALMRGHDRAAVYRAMGIEAAASVLSGRDSRYASMIEAQIRSMSIRLSDAAVPLALWWSAGAVATQPAQARNVIGSVLPRVRAGIEIIELFFPEPLSIYAGRADDTTLLEELAGWSETDSSPWSRAHWALTRGLAQEALGKAGARDVLSEAAAAVKELGCDYFAAFASERSNTAATAKRKVQDPDGKSARVSRPTARELQIARMVADGMSNRRIAEELVLSERTVEAHLANIFAKLDISSRVQLVALASRGEL